MYAIFLKLLGTLHGALGLFALAMILASSLGKGFLVGLSSPRAAFKVLGGAIGAALLISTMWAAWVRPEIAASFAWASVAIYVLTATADEVYDRGANGLLGLMPAFYITVVVRSLAAGLVGVLARGS